MKSASEVRDAVKGELTHYLAEQRDYLTSIASELIPVCDALEDYLLEGGKRLRPLFAYAGFLAAGSTPSRTDIRAMASLELLQACALIHDDLMDGSDTRRGKPAIHRHFENLHRQGSLAGLADKFGEAAAVLLGDLALVWSDHMLHNSGLSHESLTAALRIHDEMRIELMAGQYLDVREAGEREHSVERSLRIARYKSGKYTIERPLHLGAVIARPSATEHSELLNVLSAYGLPLGEAFQLRDDMLGIFGDPKETGKPAGDDLREGKRTVLMAMTMEKASSGARAELSAHLGKPDLSPEKIESLRTLIVETGAIADVEKLIDRLGEESVAAANSAAINENARPFLLALAETAIRRSY
ncbi:polyprenyl synthetase family protein [Candidatus Planktophila dulcis]|uniref:polyprenyl synthetase family protein n=1 Tax=Candidatus Planktophila dulcis TaxID=1884914 RepID=UPI003CE87AAC